MATKGDAQLPPTLKKAATFDTEKTASVRRGSVPSNRLLRVSTDPSRQIVKPPVKSAPPPDEEKKHAIHKVLTHWQENPGNFHQAACVYLLGGKEADRQTNFPRPENVSRFTNSEMSLAWDNANNSISKTEQLVCRFMHMNVAGKSLGVDSPGLRAAKVGQGGGGLYVCDCGPHELGWDQWQSGPFREIAGKELYGQKWREVFAGGQYQDRLDVVFFLKIPKSIYQRAQRVPGRPNTVIISSDVLYEKDGFQWLQKEKIVKTYLLKRDVAELLIPGEGPPPGTSLQTKVVFAIFSIALVLFQAIACYAIYFDTQNPSCVTNTQCRRGMWCTALSGVEGRCEYCAYASRWGLDLDAVAYCADKDHYSEIYCDESTGFTDLECSHPACRACPGADKGRNPGWGSAYRIAKSKANVSVHPDDKWFENSTWGTTSAHSEVWANSHSMQFTDAAVLTLVAAVVSFKIAEECKDIMLCEVTIANRGGNMRGHPKDWIDWMLVVVLVGAGCALYFKIFVLGAFASTIFPQWGWMLGGHQIILTPMIFAIIDVRSGRSPWPIFLVGVSALRRFGILPLLASSIPSLVLFGGSNAKDIALNAVAAIFMLDIDNLAFKYAMPAPMRIHVETYGRAQLDDVDVRTISAVKMWTWIPLFATIVIVVGAARYIHDQEGGWFRGPNWTVAGGPNEIALFITTASNTTSLSAAALLVGKPDSAKGKSKLRHGKVLVGLVWAFALCCPCIAVFNGLTFEDSHGTFTGKSVFYLVWAVGMIGGTIVLWVMDKGDGGRRTMCMVAQFIRFWMGTGMTIAIQYHTNWAWHVWTPVSY
eukprot:SAG25_NODE_282_length_10426_cov_27.226784_6_plen_818_part_00